MQEQQPSTETVTLATAGPIPGIPGTHGPGTYLVNWLERTITPVVNAVENAIQHVEEMEHPAAPADAPQSAPEGSEEPAAS